MRKNIALVLALVMILSLLPMTAFAASDNSVDKEPNVAEDFLFTETDAPVLRIEEKNAGEWSASTFTFRLNLTNAEFREVAAVQAENFKLALEALNSELVATKRTKTSYNITVEAGAALGGGPTKVIEIPLVTKVLEGEARVTIDPLGTAVSGGSWTFAVATEGDTITTVVSDEKVGRGTSDAGTILIDEASVSALTSTTQEFRLRLPRNVEWASGTVIRTEGLDADDANIRINNDGTWVDPTVASNWDDLPNSGRDLEVQVVIDGPSGTRGTILVESEITVSRSASFGDIEVALRGLEGEISDESNLKIAEYVDFAAAVDVDEVIEMYAGRYDEDYEITIEIDPQLEFSLAEGRFIEFELPDWAAFVSGDGVRVNDHVREFEVTNPMANSTDDIEFDFVIIANATAVPAGQTMIELEMVVSGGGVPETEVVVAEVLAPVTVEVGEQVGPLSIGTQRQATPEIIITENYPGAIMDMNGNNEINVFIRDQFAGSLRFDNVDYEILEGDLEIDDVTITDRAAGGENTQITIEIDVASDDEAAVIRLYNIEMTLDRTVPFGLFRLDIGGNALIDYDGVDYDFASRVARFDYMTVGTPVDPTVVEGGAQVTFTIGQSAYLVDGEMKMMDTAPFISEGRTMVPVKYLEELFGMSPIWNASSRTVTIMYENKVYEMAIGSQWLKVNGANFLEMETPATIVDDRTFVPISRFALAMGIDYTWDAATQTVVFN